MNIMLVEKMSWMMVKYVKLSDGVWGSCYFYWFYDDLDDILLKKEQESLPRELRCGASAKPNSTNSSLLSRTLKHTPEIFFYSKLRFSFLDISNELE